MKQTALLLLILTVILSACAASPDPTIPAVKVDELTITYTPESCIYDGPEVIQAGEVRIVYENPSDANIIHGVFLLDEGKTWQDILDNSQDERKNVGMPDEWAHLQGGALDFDDTRAKVYSLEPGLYALVCGEILDTGSWINWLAGPLQVK
jgi:hypothetical protein